MIRYKKYIPLTLGIIICMGTVNAHWFPFFNSGNTNDANLPPEISAHNKMMRDMNFGELEYTKNKHVKNKNYEIALKYLEKMVTLCENLEVESAVRLELADLLFTCEKYKNAGLQYRQFYQLYRNDSKAEYALYRAICCCSKQLCEPSRDQSNTIEAIELADEFLGFETFTAYADEITEIRKTCQRELLKSGISIFKDYVCRKHFKSAYNRLNSIEKTFSEEFENLDQVIVQLEQEWSDAAGMPYPKKVEGQERIVTINLAEVSQDTGDSLLKSSEEIVPETLLAEAS